MVFKRYKSLIGGVVFYFSETFLEGGAGHVRVESMRIPLASTGLRPVDVENALKVLNSGNLTMGKEVKAFESAMAAYLKCDEFIMVNSGSSANLAMVEALLRPAKSKPRLHPGDKILVPAIAWPTTIWPLIQLGLIPVFVDVNSQNLAIDLISAQEVVNKSGGSVKGIFPIHPLGYAIPNSTLENFVDNNGLVLINDVCESLGSWSEGRHAGSSGIAGSFSFLFFTPYNNYGRRRDCDK